MKLVCVLSVIPLLVSGFKNTTSADYRRNIIRNEFLFTWMNYKHRAMGKDELRPVDGIADYDIWGGYGVTLIDSLDTLWLMGLYEEFSDAVQVINKTDFKKGVKSTSFFEVTIRNLGGLIAGYDLSGISILLDKAVELADILLKNFDSPSGFPYTDFNFRTQEPERESAYASLANIGTCQLEFTRLSLITGDNKYRDVALAVYNKLDQNKPGKGLYYADLDVKTGNFTSKSLTFGAYGDSFFEYLIKLYAMLGPNETNRTKYLKMFDESIDMFKFKLLRFCYSDRLCVGSTNGNGDFEPYTQHLNFFVPGMFLLADEHLPGRHLKSIGLDLLKTFSFIPSLSLTGLAPEMVEFFADSEIKIVSKANLLRPELIESLFYAHRYTHQPQHQELAWTLFEAFRNYSLTNFGYSVYGDVNNIDKSTQFRNQMPSFFLAETFKYLYLIFDDDQLNLDDWVLNTEAHPFRKSL